MHRKRIKIMNAEKIIYFLQQVMANNNREWFHAHRDEYDEARQEWERGVAQAMAKILSFDTSVAHLQVKDCVYRFYRDTRFSPDKSPYKNHFGAYINAHGKKALRGGYYMHIEPGQCMVAVGNYWLPTNILTACRNEIMSNETEWISAVESRGFKRYYGAGEDANWDSPQGFGLTKLKTCPAGFPRDYKHVKYLRMKDYCAWHRVPDSFFSGDAWLDEMARMFRAAKPMMDFVNAVVDDYE